MIAAPAMAATVLIYSGRPNPRWTVPPPAAAEIAAAMDSMPALPDGRTPEPGLGYSGIMLEISAPGARAVTWKFSNGMASFEGHRFSDVGRKIEKMILQSGRAHIDRNILPQLLGQ